MLELCKVEEDRERKNVIRPVDVATIYVFSETFGLVRNQDQPLSISCNVGRGHDVFRVFYRWMVVRNWTGAPAQPNTRFCSNKRRESNKMLASPSGAPLGSSLVGDSCIRQMFQRRRPPENESAATKRLAVGLPDVGVESANAKPEPALCPSTSRKHRFCRRNSGGGYKASVVRQCCGERHQV